MTPEEEKLKYNLAKNLVHYRKLAGLTQLELAQKINYSDKSISKWERAEGAPDIYVLKRLADFYDVSVDALLSGEEEPPMPNHFQQKRRILITFLSVGLVWLVATFVFFVFRTSIQEQMPLWYCFLVAVPVSAVVAVVFTALWWNKIWQFISVSLLIWGTAICLYVMVDNPYMYLIFVLAGVIQVLLVLWYILKHYSGREKKHE